MSKAAEDMEGMETAQLEAMGEEMMEEMMKKFEQMGEKVRLCGAADAKRAAEHLHYGHVRAERLPGPRGRHDAAAAVERCDVRPDEADLRAGASLSPASSGVDLPMTRAHTCVWQWATVFVLVSRVARRERVAAVQGRLRAVRQHVDVSMGSAIIHVFRTLTHCGSLALLMRSYGKQYQYFQQIIAVYESEPDNFARLSELMQAMQETGQPPSEIVKDLAPGLEFGDDGMPVMPNMVRALAPTRLCDPSYDL